MRCLDSFQRIHRVRAYHVSCGSILTKIGIGFLLFVFLCGRVSAAHVTPSEDVQSYLNVRSSPSPGGAIIAQLYPGERAALIRTVGDWYEVQLPNGSRGFVSTSWTKIIEESTDVKSTPSDTLSVEQMHILSDSINRLHENIDSLTKYIESVELEKERGVPSQESNIVLIVTILAAVFVIISAILTRRLLHAKRELRRAEQSRIEEQKRAKEQALTEGKKEEKFRRRAYFVVSSPRIVPSHDTFCDFYVNVINSGDNPAISLKAGVYMIDIGSAQATLYKEFHFSTANPIASQKDITFSEKNIDFSTECTPKFVCIALDYSDTMVNKSFQQRYTFKWNGIINGKVREDFEHVDKERSLQIWLTVRELKWSKS